MKGGTFLMTTAILIVGCLTSCMDQDPFGLSTRDIAGAYELKQWEDGSTYYLNGPSDLTHQAWGAIEGTIGKIGWSGGVILVWQNDCGSGEGWRIIDAKKNTISPIVGQDRIDGDPSLNSITLVTAADAWDKLK